MYRGVIFVRNSLRIDMVVRSLVRIFELQADLPWFVCRQGILVVLITCEFGCHVDEIEGEEERFLCNSN